MRGYLGNSARSRPKGQGRPNRGNDPQRGGRPDDFLPEPDYNDAEGLDVITPSELDATRDRKSVV